MVSSFSIVASAVCIFLSTYVARTVAGLRLPNQLARTGTGSPKDDNLASSSSHERTVASAPAMRAAFNDSSCVERNTGSRERDFIGYLLGVKYACSLPAARRSNTNRYTGLPAFITDGRPLNRQVYQLINQLLRGNNIPL